MTQKWTQEEACKRSLKMGFELIGKYINANTKTQFICPKCSKIFLATPAKIWHNCYQSCGCQRIAITRTKKTKHNIQVGQRFGKLTVTKVD